MNVDLATSRSCESCRAPFNPDVAAYRLCRRCARRPADRAPFRTVAEALGTAGVARVLEAVTSS